LESPKRTRTASVKPPTSSACAGDFGPPDVGCTTPVPENVLGGPVHDVKQPVLPGRIPEALGRPDVKAKLEASSARAIGGSTAEAAKFIKRESLRWREIIELAGIKGE
jgi:hypothetical protein